MTKTQDLKQRLIFLVLSIILNAAGNGLAIATNLGSAIWTASAVNLTKVIHISLGNTLFIYGIVVTLVNQLLLGKFNRKRLISNLLYALPFSYLVNIFNEFWHLIGVDHLSLVARFPLNLIALFTVAAAVSMYTRVNILMHPNDDLSYIIRFKFSNGQAVISQWISYIPPITIILICFFINHQVFAVGFGTIWSVITQGYFIKWSDLHIFKRLKHHVDL